jgi:spermidine synthase
VKPFLGDRGRNLSILVYGLLALGTAIGLTRPLLALAPAVMTSEFAAGAPALAAYGFVMAVLAAPTLLLGALFPVSLELYCTGTGDLRKRAGRAYAFNTLAGIAGSVAAGFWVIPEFGTDRLLLGLAWVLILAALACVFWSGPAVRRGFATTGAVLLAAAVFAVPALDFRPLVRAVTARDPATAGDDPATWHFEYFREAQAGVVSVLTRDGVAGALQTNGLTESHINFLDPTVSSPTESLLGLMPYLLHRDPRTAFVVGFGGGNTAFALTRTRDLERIRVVELEPAIVDAVHTVTRGFVPALVDPRVELDINDARNALLVDESLYDLIVSQPSHPWLAGSGTLFTREFFSIVNSRLEPGGIFGQWVNLFHMDSVTLGAILKSFYEVFPYGFTLRPGGGRDLLVFGSQWPLVFDPDRLETRFAHRELNTHLGRFGKRSAASFLEEFALSRTEILLAVQTGPANTDTNLLSEVRLATLGGGFDGTAEVDRFLTGSRGFDVVPHLRPEDRTEVMGDLAGILEGRGRSGDAALVRAATSPAPPPRLKHR